MDVVGDPVAGEGAAAAVTVDGSHNLHLVGVAPDTGHVVWSKPFSESLIDPNLPPEIDSLGNEAIDLVPAVPPQLLGFRSLKGGGPTHDVHVIPQLSPGALTPPTVPNNHSPLGYARMLDPANPAALALLQAVGA